jgi:ABC-2 type transport system permease protein
VSVQAPASSPKTVPAAAAGPDVLVGLGQALALCDRQVKRTLRAPGKFIGVAMNPVVMIIALGVLFGGALAVPGGADYRSYMVAGVAVQVGLSCIGPTAISIAVDQKSGLMVRTRTMPVHPWTGLVAQVFADLVAAAVALVLVSGIGLLLGWRVRGSVGDVLLSWVLLFTFYAATIWVGVLLGLLVSNPEALEPAGAGILVVFSFLSNAFISPDSMPAGLRQVAEWNPVSAVATTCRELWGLPSATTSTSFAAVHPQLIAIVSVLSLLVAGAVASNRLLQRSAH